MLYESLSADRNIEITFTDMLFRSIHIFLGVEADLGKRSR